MIVHGLYIDDTPLLTGKAFSHMTKNIIISVVILFGKRLKGGNGACSLLGNPDFPLYLWYVLTCRSRFDIDLWEVRDKEI